MSFIYALVFKDQGTVLAEYTSSGGNFQVITHQILSQLAISKKQRFITDQYNFDFLKEGALTFMAMTEIGLELELVYAFLMEMRQNFLQKFNFQRISEVNRAHALDDEFAPTIRLIMIRYNTEGVRIKTKAIIQDMDELKNIVVKNLADIIERGEKLQILVNKADHLEKGSKSYKKNARELRKRMTRKNIGYCIGVIVVYIILVLCCGWKVNSC